MTQEPQQEQRVSTTLDPGLHVEVKQICAAKRGLTLIQVMDAAVRQWVDSNLQEAAGVAKG